MKEEKQRHGCVTTWLILIMITSSFAIFFNLIAYDYFSKAIPKTIPFNIRILLSVIGLTNIFFAFRLLRWKKWAFWGCLCTATITFIINISIGTGIFPALMGIVSPLILFAILQIKQDNVSAWNNLE